MRALTVQQPWAWAIIHGGKDVENRTQAWKYRGPLAIHAGARISGRGMESPLIGEALKRLGHVMPPGVKHPILINDFGHLWGAQIYTGAIIGVVDLVDVHTAVVYQTRDSLAALDCCESPWAETGYTEHSGRQRRDIVHLEVANPRPLTPIPAVGRLGLWTPDVDLLAAIEEQLR
jgi:hypothetical protein